MKSIVTMTNTIELPLIEGEYQMIPFDLLTLEGLNDLFKGVAKHLLVGINASGVGFLTIHGKKLHKGETLRRGGPHTDGNYDADTLDWGNGWKVGENGPAITSQFHQRSYNAETGGIILASNYESCLGWQGEFDGLPDVGGDCSKIKLNSPFILKRNTVYYGNNHFIHESLPVNDDVHRVFARITLPEMHRYGE
jgi:hypothetical protein